MAATEWDELQERIQVWRKILVGPGKSWVLFRNGTCVVVVQPQGSLPRQAQRVLEDWGPVGTDNPTAEYRVVKLTRDPGWVVACHHPDILVYVGPQDLPMPDPPEERIGLLGRGRRYADAAELEVVHTEDNRES